MSAPLKLNGVAGSVSKTGLASITVPFYVDTLAEALTVTPDFGISLPLAGRQFRETENGGFEVSLTYEGLEDDPTDDQADFELDVSMSDDPIQTHPMFAVLKALYGWDTAEERFPETDPNQQPSPAYGAESYLTVGAVFRITTTRRSIPGSVLKGIGTITAAPPGIAQFQIPNADGQRNWLKSAPKIKRKGNAVNITEEYLLSGPKGWLPTIYSAAQLT
jgi:hypothetical protein